MQSPPQPLLLLRSPRRIAILRALVLGDMLCAVPAFRALRRAYPDSEITLIGLPWAREFVERFDQYLDRCWIFPGASGMPEGQADAARLAELFRHARQAGFDLAIQLHGSGEITNPIVEQLGARQTAGFYRPPHMPSDASLFLPYPDHEPEIWRNLRLMEHLGVPLAGEYLEFPLREADFEQLAALPAADKLRHGEYICLHPGARYLSRRWPIERFAAVADSLARRGWQIVITAAGAEQELAARLSATMRRPHLNMAGATTLGSLAALLDGARLLISNDTGVSHLAAALRVPSVVVVTGSDPRRWAPLDRARHRVVRHAVACQPCEHIRCPIDFACASGIEPSAVERAALESLAAFAMERDADRHRNQGFTDDRESHPPRPIVKHAFELTVSHHN